MHGDRAPPNNKPFWFVLTICTGSEPIFHFREANIPENCRFDTSFVVVATLSVTVYAIVDFLHAESNWTVFRASTAAVLLLLWPLWLLFGSIVYFSKVWAFPLSSFAFSSNLRKCQRRLPPRNTVSIATIQPRVQDLVKRDFLPYNPIVLMNSIYGQLQMPRRFVLFLVPSLCYFLHRRFVDQTSYLAI